MVQDFIAIYEPINHAIYRDKIYPSTAGDIITGMVCYNAFVNACY